METPQSAFANASNDDALANASDDNDYKGIRGWLIFWLICAFLGLILKIFHLHLHMLSGDAWELVTTPGTDFYHPLWKPLLIYEFVLQFLTLSALAGIILLFLFKSRLFPKFIIGFYLVNFILFLVDAIGSHMVVVAVNLQVRPDWQGLARCLFGVCVWVPYFLKSKRVKATFTK